MIINWDLVVMIIYGIRGALAFTGDAFKLIDKILMRRAKNEIYTRNA